MKNKAAIYARVSTIDKQEFSRQVDELTIELQRNGYSNENIDVYAEKVSGYKFDERIQLQRLIKMTEDNPSAYDVIYTSEISRIGRDPQHTRAIIERWTALGIPLFILSLGQSTLLPNGSRNTVVSIILQVLIEYADLEAIVFKTRSRSGLLRSAKMGKAGGSNNFPYGYMKDEYGLLVVSEQEKPVIQRIFDEYENGNGIKVIAGGLNRDNVPTRLNLTHGDREIKFKKTTPKKGSTVRWSDKQVLDILNNTLYKGQRKFKGEIIAAPAIISEEQFDRCTAMRKTKTHKNYLTKYIYLLKNKIKCGKCGRNYYAKYKPVPKGDKVYICSSRLNKSSNCGNHGVNIFLIESAINEIIFGSEVILRYIGEKNSMAQITETEINNLRNMVELEQHKITEVKNSIVRLDDAYFTHGALSFEKYSDYQYKYNTNLENATERLQTLRKNLADKERALKSLRALKTTKKAMAEAMKDRVQLESYFKQFIAEVIVSPIDITETMLAVYIQMGEVVLPNPLLVKLNLSGMRVQPPRYKYKVYYTDNQPNSEGDMFDEIDFDVLPWQDIQPQHILSM
jgi:site-specific DNA recombinase